MAPTPSPTAASTPYPTMACAKRAEPRSSTPYAQCDSCADSGECTALLALYQSAMDGCTDMTAFSSSDWVGCPSSSNQWPGARVSYGSSSVDTLEIEGEGAATADYSSPTAARLKLQSLPTEVGYLTSLTSMSVTLQAVRSGTIPTELGSIKDALQGVALQSNGF